MIQLLDITINTNGTSLANFITDLASNNSALYVSLLGTYESVQLGNGNDTVLLGVGNDTVTLGNGNDLINIDGSTTTTSTDILNLGTGINNIIGTGDVNVSINAANAVQANINLSGSTGFDSVTAGNGNFDIHLGSNAGSISAGNGNNDITIGNVNSPVSMTLGNGQNIVSIGNGVVDVITIGNGNNNQVTAGNETLALVTMGNGNNDSVVMGTGQDYVTMGNGNDDYVSLGNGNNTVIMGSGYCNQVFLGNGSNYIDAGAGSDVVIAGNGGASGNMFIYEAETHPLVSESSSNGFGCGSSCGNSYNICGNSCIGDLENLCQSNGSCYGNLQNVCQFVNSECGINLGNCCSSSQQGYTNSCGANSCGSTYSNNACESNICCGSGLQNACSGSILFDNMDYSYYSGGGNLNTLEINMTNAQYLSYLALDSQNFAYSIPSEYVFASIPLIINNMTNIVFNDINAAANTDTLHFISAPSGQVYQGSEGLNILDYSGILPSTANIQNEVLHVDLVAGQTELTNTSDTLVGHVDTVMNFNNVIGADNDYANVIKIASLASSVDGGQNAPVHDAALNGIVTNTLISNNELDLSGLSGNINISSTGTGTHGTWTDIGIINLGANTSLNLDAAGLPALEQHNVSTLIINSSSAAAGASDTVTANDLSNWTELSKTVTQADPNGVSHTYNVYTHGTQTLLIDTNIHIQNV